MARAASSVPEELRAIQESLADRIDKRLAVIIGTSLVVHISIAAWAWATDVEIPTLGTPPIAQTFHQDVMDVTLPDEPRLPSEQGAATPVAPGQTPAPIVPPTRIVNRAPAALPTPDDAIRLATALTTETPGTRGPTPMSSRTPGGDLQNQVDDIRDNHLTIGNDTGGFRHDPTSRPGTTTGPVVDDRHQIARTTPHHTGEVPRDRFRLVPEPPTGIGVTPTADEVVGRISAVYLVGLQRCYQHALTGGAPSNGGKVAISFTVNETGRVVEAEAHGMDDVDSCFRSQMLTWRFPTPKDAHGSPTEMGYGVTVVLQAAD